MDHEELFEEKMNKVLMQKTFLFFYIKLSIIQKNNSIRMIIIEIQFLDRQNTKYFS